MKENNLLLTDERCPNDKILYRKNKNYDNIKGEKMNKKFTKLIAFLLVLTTLLFTACSSNKTTHVHDFIVQSSDAKFLSEEATCSSPALYYLSCSCGEKGDKTFEFGTK